MRLTNKQTKAWLDFRSPVYTRYLHDGGARSGKTFLIALWLLSEAEKYPNAKILLCRKHYNHCVSTIWTDTLLPLLRVMPGWTYTLSPTITATHVEGGQLLIAGLDNSERVDKLLGDEYTHIFINEATQCGWSMIQTLLTRLARNAVDAEGKEVKRQLILDCNPKSPRHWLHRVGVEQKDPDTLEPIPDASKWVRRHWTPLDNPHLADDYIETLKALPEVTRKRMLSGIWCDNEGVVYEEFSESIHCFDELPAGSENWSRLGGIDFGYNNPFVFLWGAIDGDGCLWIYKEMYKSKMIVEDHCKAIKAEETLPRKVVADHDAEDRATMRKHGIYTVAAKKDILKGIEHVKQRLIPGGNGRPRLMISSRCRNTLNEIYAYSWPESKEGRAEKEVPLDLDNHAMDAMRYMVAELDIRGGSRML